jgi:hypothetical protein
MYRGLRGALLGLGAAQPAFASPSVYTTAPDEPRAVTASGVGDGLAADAPAIQQVIDKAAEKGGGGIRLPADWHQPHQPHALPVARDSHLRHRRTAAGHPVGQNTPGFQRGVAHMLMFTGAKR